VNLTGPQIRCSSTTGEPTSVIDPCAAVEAVATTLERLEAQADELGSAGKAVGAEIRALREIIQLAME